MSFAPLFALPLAAMAMSGDALPKPDADSARFADVLVKPLSAQALQRAVRDVLAGATTGILAAGATGWLVTQAPLSWQRRFSAYSSHPARPWARRR